MRILLITHYFQPDSGAAAVRLSRLAKFLQQRGHEITVLTTMPHYPVGHIRDGYRGKFTVTEEVDGLKIIRAWLWATPSSSIAKRLISQISFMIALVLRGLFVARPDVVLIENQPVFTALGGWLICTLKRVPYVANVSDFWPEYLLTVGILQETGLIYKVFKALVNIIQRAATAIIVLHEPLKESIEARIGRVENLHVVYNAVDLDRFQPTLDTRQFREKYDLNDHKLVTFAGTFGTHIDFDTMLNAAAQFNHRDDVLFLLIGTGGQRSKIEDLLQQPEFAHVRWINWLEHQEMPVAWAASYIAFWAIYDSELYRQTLQSKNFEAMASGTPVVIAIEGLTSTVVEKSGSGITVPFGDVSGMVEAITLLLDDAPHHAEFSHNARAYAEEHFNPEKVADAYETILQQAMT